MKGLLTRNDNFFLRVGAEAKEAECSLYAWRLSATL
jgi:hypothetical protein